MHRELVILIQMKEVLSVLGPLVERVVTWSIGGQPLEVERAIMHKGLEAVMQQAAGLEVSQVTTNDRI